MGLGDDSLPTAFLSAKEQDVKPLLAESVQELELDGPRLASMETYLHKTWFFGVKTGHRVMLEAELGESDPASVILSMRDEFQDLMEDLAEELNLTVGATITAWNYLGRAWLAGARFWEVEIAARLIESQAGGFDELLRWLGE